MKIAERKIFYKIFCKNHSTKIKIDITDIYRNTNEISYYLEFVSSCGRIKRHYDYSLSFYEKDGEFLVFLVFDLGFCADLCNARLIQFIKDEFGKVKKILYSFELN